MDSMDDYGPNIDGLFYYGQWGRSGACDSRKVPVKSKEKTRGMSLDKR